MFEPQRKTFKLNVSPVMSSHLTGENIINPTTGKEPTREEINYFKEHRKDILEPPLFAQSKRTGTALHGAQSRNIIMEHDLGDVAHQKGLIKPTYDYDVWSKNPKKSAIEIEKTIDKKIGSDMTYIKVEAISKAPGTTGTKRDFERYTLMARATPATRQEVDYATFPIKSERPYNIVKIGGVKHEDVVSALDRAHDIKYHPKRYFKTFADIHRMKTYQELIGEKK